jgi:hypothetical protein
MATISVFASADNWIDKNQPTYNWNNQLGFVRIGDQGGGDGARALFRFVMPTDPLGSGSVIDKIEFFGFIINSGNYTAGVVHNIYEGVNTPSTTWVEGQCTWNVYSSGNNWTASGAASDFSANVAGTWTSVVGDRGAYKSVPILGTGSVNPITTDWGETINLMVRAPSSTSHQCDIRHREYSGTASDPYILITYDVAPTPTASHGMFAWF